MNKIRSFALALTMLLCSHMALAADHDEALEIYGTDEIVYKIYSDGDLAGQQTYTFIDKTVLVDAVVERSLFGIVLDTIFRFDAFVEFNDNYELSAYSSTLKTPRGIVKIYVRNDQEMASARLMNSGRGSVDTFEISKIEISPFAYNGVNIVKEQTYFNPGTAQFIPTEFIKSEEMLEHQGEDLAVSRYHSAVDGVVLTFWIDSVGRTVKYRVVNLSGTEYVFELDS